MVTILRKIKSFSLKVWTQIVPLYPNLGFPPLLTKTQALAPNRVTPFAYGSVHATYPRAWPTMWIVVQLGRGQRKSALQVPLRWIQIFAYK